MADEILRTYGDTSIREDVNSFVELLTAVEAWFLNNLGKSQAYGPVHQTQVDTLPAAASLAVQEGTDLAASSTNTPTLLANIVQHVARTFHVSDVQRKVAHFNGEDMLAYQTVKAAKELGNGIEFDLVRSVLVSGVSGTTPKMKKKTAWCLINTSKYDIIKLWIIHVKNVVSSYLGEIKVFVPENVMVSGYR